MTFRAPVRKPYGVAPSPYMAQGAGKGLWKGLAFIAPFQTPKGAGTSTLLDQFGHPLAGSNLTAGSTLQWRNTPYGLGVGISGASDCLYQSNFAPIVTSDGAGAGDLSIVCLANPKAEARVSCLVSQGDFNSPYPYVLMYANSTWDGIATSGQYCFAPVSGSDVSANVAGAIDGRYHLYGGVRRGQDVIAFIDGVSRATTTGTAQDVLISGCSLAIGSLADLADTRRIATDCNIVFCAAWNRALTNFEMLLLGIDPFIMFRPAPRQKIINTVAAGGTAVPVFMHHYMQQRGA